MTNFEKVRLFMTTFGQEVKKKSGLSSDKINNLRINLIEEELIELKDAVNNKVLKCLKTLYPFAKQDELELMSSINSKADIKQYLKNLGYEDKQFKELL